MNGADFRAKGAKAGEDDSPLPFWDNSFHSWDILMVLVDTISYSG